MGKTWSAAACVAIWSVAGGAGALAETPLNRGDIKNIKPVSLSPATPRAPEIVTAALRPVQRGALAFEAVDRVATYRFWSDTQVTSLYEGYWFEAQSAVTRQEVNLLAERMGALWEVMGERGLQGAVNAPDLTSVGWFLHETGVEARETH